MRLVAVAFPYGVGGGQEREHLGMLQWERLSGYRGGGFGCVRCFHGVFRRRFFRHGGDIGGIGLRGVTSSTE